MPIAPISHPELLLLANKALTLAIAAARPAVGTGYFEHPWRHFSHKPIKIIILDLKWLF
jgi:hypothetical protein